MSKTAQVTTIEYDATAVLKYIMDTGSIDLHSVAADMKKKELNEIIKMHPHPITQGKDGRYRTYVKYATGKRKQIAKTTLEKLHEALFSFYKYEKDNEPSPYRDATLTTLFPEWLEYKKLHAASPGYIRRIQSDWNNYYKDSDIAKTPIIKLKKLDLDIWAHALIKQIKQSKKQYYNISMILRQMLDYAVDLEIVESNVFSKVHIDSRMVFLPQKKKSNESQVFSKKEVTALYEYAWEDFRSKHNTVHKLAPLAVMFQFQVGVRLGELCCVRYEDIENDEIFIQRMYRFEDKEIVDYTKCHNEGRYVVLTSEAKKLIATAKEYQIANNLNSEGYIFSVTGEPLSYYSVRKLYARYCKNIGIIHKSSHKARKTYISALIDGGVNINTIREMVGHADERTTYNSYCFDRSSKSVRKALVEKALI